MTLTLIIGIVAFSFLILQVSAQTYVVWSSVVVLRAGDRTPLNLNTNPSILTSLGAQQLYSVGQSMRSRYITNSQGSSGTDGVFYAPLQGLSANTPDDTQLYILSLDEQFAVASAQAFMQGFYPPTAWNTSNGYTLDPYDQLSNGTYVGTMRISELAGVANVGSQYVPPLNGYQYPHFHVASGLDPNLIYIGGDLDCPALDASTDSYSETVEYSTTEASSQAVYNAIGGAFLSNTLLPSQWNYGNAWAIYDYINYLNIHNVSVHDQLATPAFSNPDTNISYLDELRWLADRQQFAYLGNLSAKNPYGATAATATAGSISTIAGATLAARIFELLNTNIETDGQEYKLGVLLTDFDPLLSLFALAGLPNLNSNFYGLPDYGSALVFELFSWSADNTSDSSSMPDATNLWVRFYFRNGTGLGINEPVNTNADLQSYPLFGHGPSTTDLTYAEFAAAISEIAIANPGDWCSQCGAMNLFCAAWNASDSAAGSGSSGSSSSSATRSSHEGMSPAVAGVIGAIVTLAVMALLVVAAMLIAGLRFYRSEPRLRGGASAMAGFKGSRKMTSDRDLVLPKGVAVVAEEVERKGSIGQVSGARERVGSWEMKDKDHRSAPSMDARTRNMGPYLEDDGLDDADCIDAFSEPVREHERV